MSLGNFCSCSWRNNGNEFILGPVLNLRRCLVFEMFSVKFQDFHSSISNTGIHHNPVPMYVQA